MIPAPGRIVDAAISGGIAFIAASFSGFHVVNYMAFDNQGQPPAVNISATENDLDPNTPGVQVVEGTSIPIRVDVTDDVQVRNVELLVNGQVVASDSSFPFDLSGPALGADANATTATFEVRAFDTGGNAGLSAPLVFDLLPDTIAPSLVSVTPADGTMGGRNLRVVRLRFSEPMTAQTFTNTNIRLISTTDPAATFSPVNVRVRNGGRDVEFTYSPLPFGEYQVTLNAPAITDRAGNPLISAGIVSTFEVSGVTPAAEFVFQGSLADEVGGPPLGLVGQPGQFADATVFGIPQQVYEFDANQGLELATEGLIAADEYSLEMIFRFDDDSGYRKIVDFENQTRDTGLYVNNGRLVFYGGAINGTAPAGQYVQVILTRNAATKEVVAYIDGFEVFRFTDDSDIAVIDNPNHSLRFFVDDDPTNNNEASSGALALLRVYDDVLTAEDVALLTLSPRDEPGPPVK
jgi:hypothetical protein